jgi:hypothetical protein
MKHPPYFLRFNKAADRLTLIEAIKRIGKLGNDLEDYTYYSLGGPFLDDFRLMYEFFPEIALVSIEETEETFKRQLFHRPCGKIILYSGDMNSFISQYQSEGEKSIFWLDYTGLKLTHFDDFKRLLRKISKGSLVKITLQADPKEYFRGTAEEREASSLNFRRTFENYLPDPTRSPPKLVQDFVSLIQKMLEIAANQAFPAEETPLSFQPISSFYYSDSTWMLTLTGVVWPREQSAQITRAFRSWEFLNQTWSNPRLISIPILTTKERLLLQGILPGDQPCGSKLFVKLGYRIEDDDVKTVEALEQYAAFHRYSPYFMQGFP